MGYSGSSVRPCAVREGNPFDFKRAFMNAGKVWSVFFLVLFLYGFALPALAESETQKKQAAKEHYEVATRFFDLGKYGEAIQEYEAAYLLVPDPNLLYNIGQAYRLWDRPEEAVRSYKNYLRNRPDAPNRAEVERRIAELERRSTEHTKAAPESPTAAPAPAPQPVQQPVPLATPPAVSPTVQPVPPASVAEQSKPEVAPARPSWLDRHSRTGAYVVGGAGGVCLVTSLVTGIIAAQKAKRLADDSKNPAHPVFDPSIQSSGKTLNKVAIITGASGLVLGGVGLYLFSRSQRVAEAARGEVRKPVAFYPMAGPGLAGVGARVGF